MPNPSPAGQASAAWLQAPMTIAVGGATGSGQILPDSGINYAFLTAPAGAAIPTSACPNPPGGNGCANAGIPVQVFLPGQTTPQIAFYNFTTGASGNPLQPDVVQMVPGTAVFLNTGREFYAGFNYFSTRSTASSAISGTARSPASTASSSRSSPRRAT
jgi:hypothetical protein